MAFRFKRKKETGDALWIRCSNCESQVYKQKVELNLEVCPECGWHYRINTSKRIQQLVDDGTFIEIDSNLEPIDALGFKAKKSYKEKLAKAFKETGRKDSATFGYAMIGGIPVLFGVIDALFIMGSMGSVCGEKIARAAEEARDKSVPLLIISGSGGGARMEEGVLSLMQMAKVSAAIGRLQDDGGLYIVVLTNATMGGSMASFASLGDIILAEPQALLGFTGPRGIQQTIKKEMELGEEEGEFSDVDMDTSELVVQNLPMPGENTGAVENQDSIPQTASQILANLDGKVNSNDQENINQDSS